MLRSTSVMCIPARDSLLTAAIPAKPMPTTTTRGAVPLGLRRAFRLNIAIPLKLPAPLKPPTRHLPDFGAYPGQASVTGARHSPALARGNAILAPGGTAY